MAMKFVGADGCKKKWFAVILADNGKFEVELFDDIANLWDNCHDANLILLDVPIGLREKGDPKHLEERTCDKKARKCLGSIRGRSVFPAPCREALKEATYEEASKTNQRITGRRLTRQTWNIIPYIRQVDRLLLEDAKARSRIREVHPEICFWALNGGIAMEYSKTGKDKWKGLSERIDVLQSIYPNSVDIINYALNNYLRKDVGRDDILDALAVAITAVLSKGRLKTIPDNPEQDKMGLPMEMVYHLSGA